MSCQKQKMKNDKGLRKEFTPLEKPELIEKQKTMQTIFYGTGEKGERAALVDYNLLIYMRPLHTGISG